MLNQASLPANPRRSQLWLLGYISLLLLINLLLPAGPWIARSSSPDDRGPAGTDMLLQKRIFLQPNVVKESSRRDPIPVNRDDLIFVKMEKQMPEVQEPPKPVQTLKVQTQNLDSNLHEELRALISSGNKNGAIAFIFSKLQYWKYTKRVPRPVKEMKWSTSNPHPKGFITFEPDAGGFNNIRMNFETVLAFALILNRTLVIPPTQQMYLLHKPSGLGDYFDLADLKAALPAGLLTTEEYLKLRNVSIQYGERRYEDLKELLDFLRKQGPTPKWNMHSQALAVPSIKECNLTSDIGRMPYSKEFGRPYPTLQEFMAYRKDVVEFSSMDLEAEVIHFRTDKHSNEGYRLFGNYHTFLYFSDPEWFRYTAAFIRDYMHYPEELLEHSARIAYEIMARDHVGGYCAMHVRRGDFQYKQTRIPPSEILQNVRPLINRCSKLYISTDERDKSLFKEFERNFQVFYREDFEAEFFNPIEKRLHGMLEQLICVSARTFIATELSTFSAFIHRMRAFVSAELSPNKEVYITTRKYTGDPVKDNELTKATWLLDSKPKWPHSPWSRDFHFIWFTD